MYGKVDLGLVIDSGAAAGSLGCLNLKTDGDSTGGPSGSTPWT